MHKNHKKYLRSCFKTIFFAYETHERNEKKKYFGFIFVCFVCFVGKFLSFKTASENFAIFCG